MNFRFERKIALGNGDLDFVEPFLLVHAIGFRSAYPDRFIHNVYFDTLDRYSFNAHVAGIKSRAKWRLRAYDQGFWKTFEEKRKIGEHGDKFYHDPALAIEAYQKNRSVIMSERELYPVLENRYQRRYFHSPLWGIRVTLDTKIEFTRADSKNWLRDDEYSAVLEIKYDLDKAKAGDEFLKSLPWRISRYSKYVRGVRIIEGC
jgi:hypothetical protein